MKDKDPHNPKPWEQHDLAAQSHLPQKNRPSTQKTADKPKSSRLKSAEKISEKTVDFVEGDFVTMPHETKQQTDTDNLAHQLFAGRYQMGKLIGRGGMADVYYAEDTFRDNLSVAIKVMRDSLSQDKTALARFQREAQAMAELSHPHIVRILDLGESEGQSYIAMEYVSNQTLGDYLKTNAPLVCQDAVNKTIDLLSALALAHQHGIIHRDIKPNNILINPNDQVKITDFGIAKILGETGLTQTNSVLGSIYYLSPEQARGYEATAQSDIYAMGILLYEMLTGQHPFDGADTVAIALRHFQDKLPSIINLNPSVPQALENVAIRATAKKPQNRYPNALAMIADLKTSLSDERRAEAKLILAEDDTETKSSPEVTKTVTVPVTTAAPAEATAVEGPVFSQLTEVSKLPPREKPNFEKAELQKKKNNRTVPLIILGSLVTLAVAVFIIIIVVDTMPGNKASANKAASSSSLQVTVPDVTGQDQATAQKTLEKVGLSVGHVDHQYSDKVDYGQVISQSPNSGQKLKKNASVDLVLSKGQDPAKMTHQVPDVTGQDQKTAEQSLQLAGFIVGHEDQKYSSSVDSGKVISQSPTAGGKLKVGAAINLVISKGQDPATVAQMIPDVTGQEENAARASLQNAGFKVSSSSQYSDSTDKGLVISQSPVGTAKKGTTVALIVSKGPDSAPIPDVTGQSQDSATQNLAGAGFKVGNISKTYDATVPSGQVIKSSPSSDETAKLGSRVDLTISQGPNPQTNSSSSASASSN